MSKRTITVLDRQTVWDIAIREYGSVEAVFAVLVDNPELSGLNAVLVAGQKLVVRSSAVDSDVVRYYADNALWPVTGPLQDFTPEPEPEDPPNSIRLVITDNYGGDAEFFFATSTAHLRWRKPGGVEEVLSDSQGNMGQAGLAVGTHVFTPVSEEDVPSGSVTQAQFYLMEVAELSGEGCLLLPELYISFVLLPNAFAMPQLASGANLQMETVSTGATMNMSACSTCSAFYLSQDVPSLDVVVWPASMPLMENFSIVGTSLGVGSVDGGINALNPLVPNGDCFIVGGTAASPSSDSLDRRNELNAAGWDQGYN